MSTRETSRLAGRALLALLSLVACWVLAGGSASAEIVLAEGGEASTAETPHLSVEYGGENGNVEWVKSLKWRSSSLGVFGSNLSTYGGGGCGDPSEFWGQSYPNQDGFGPAPVVAGQRGSWTAASNRTVLIDSVSRSACSGNTPEIPVRTRYTFFDEGAAANTLRMERRVSFAADQQPNPAAQGMRFYVPRLPAGTYNQEIFPNEAGTALNTIGDFGPTADGDWNETWMAIDSSTTHAGMVVFHEPDGVHPASVTSDSDSSSGSNNSGVTLDRPGSGWVAPVTEVEYLCFYDATTWPTITRSPTNLPEGCATPEVPVNVAAPKISAGAGNPHLGETFSAQPGDWEHTTGGFAYQWLRCSGSGGSCAEIDGAIGTSYTATSADVGHPLKVRVTATAPGGEVDFAESNIAGTVSGHVYEGEKSVAHELAGARVQICRLKGSPCRSTSTDDEGAYRLQAPSLGDYRVTAFPPAGSNAVARTRTTVTHVSAEAEAEDQDVVLPVPQPPPPTVNFSGGGVRPTNAEGVPVVYWQEPFEIKFEAPTGKEVEAKIEFPDGLLKRLLPCSQEPKAGEPSVEIFRFCFQSLYPNHGAARVAIAATAPRSQAEKEEVEQEEEAEEAEQEEEEDEPEEPEEEPETPEEEEETEKETEEEEHEEREAEEHEEEGESEEEGSEETTFPIYIDPSGYVRLVDGSPLEGATVKLFASESAGGPFTLVPDGSAAMSPMNRHNPDATDAVGRFGWDVVAGFYKVRAEKSGCNAKGSPSQGFEETGVLTIPPPVTNLDLRLECPTPPDTGPGSNSPPAGGSGGPLPRPRPRAGLTAPRKLKVKVDRLGRFKLKAAKANCPADAGAPCQVKVVVKGLGSAVSNLAPGKTAAVSGKVSKAGLKRLRKAKRAKARLAISVTVPGGDPAAATLAVTLLLKG